jgi:phosphotransferase system enzyme I (PtsI)
MDRNRSEFTGIPASPGIVIGKVLVYDVAQTSVARRLISEDEVPEEIRRFRKACDDARAEFESVRNAVGDEFEKRIIGNYALMLGDPDLREQTERIIRSDFVNAEFALAQYMDRLERDIRSRGSDFFNDRLSDLRTVQRRVNDLLSGEGRRVLPVLKEPVVIVSHDLSPSDTAHMDKEKVVGFATDVGGRTSHTAIMARSLEIPAVVGLEKITQVARTGDHIILDGSSGGVYVNPRGDILRRYWHKQKQLLAVERNLENLQTLPAETLDGVQVELGANIEFPKEVAAVKRYGSHGVGLFRTEFLFMGRETFPTEEEQFEHYREVAEAFNPDPVTIRTLDLGGDKFASSIRISSELNPMLGSRAIRFCLSQPDLFRTQLRAILRASPYGRLRIMYPMISSLWELERANEILAEARAELHSQGIPVAEEIPVGVMIEVPSAAIIADRFAQKTDFFSIGTNDLIQYTLAVDRTREGVAHLYDPNHPAVLRLIHCVVQAGHEAGIPVAMCGEMAGDPAFVPLLLAFGLDEFSMAPIAIPEVKRVIRNLRVSDLGDCMEQVLSFASTEEVQEFIRDLNRRVLGEEVNAWKDPMPAQ